MKHTSLYGTRIDPNCEYCSHNTTPELSPNCAVHCEIDENGKCKKFAYDPLLRTPKKRPPLAKFTKEDGTFDFSQIEKTATTKIAREVKNNLRQNKETPKKSIETNSQSRSLADYF